jgi:hypothetical protein
VKTVALDDIPDYSTQRRGAARAALWFQLLVFLFWFGGCVFMVFNPGDGARRTQAIETTGTLLAPIFLSFCTLVCLQQRWKMGWWLGVAGNLLMLAGLALYFEALHSDLFHAIEGVMVVLHIGVPILLLMPRSRRFYLAN